jgi:hypothetical protein
MKLLKRFGMGVMASDSIPARAVMAANEALFEIREYALNYVGGWHSVFETEIFRLALERKTDPDCQRTLTALTARGLPHEDPVEFLGDRFGREGPFIGFPQKPEFFRCVKDGEILWLSASDPSEPGMPEPAIILRNKVVCALSDVVFIPFADKDSRTLQVTRWVVEQGIPTFTTEAEDNARLWDLGIPRITPKTVGAFLERLGARRFPFVAPRKKYRRGNWYKREPIRFVAPPPTPEAAPAVPPPAPQADQDAPPRPRRSPRAAPALFPEPQKKRPRRSPRAAPALFPEPQEKG